MIRRKCVLAGKKFATNNFEGSILKSEKDDLRKMNLDHENWVIQSLSKLYYDLSSFVYSQGPKLVSYSKVDFL